MVVNLMDKQQEFKTYNQLKRKYKVMTTTIKEVLNDSKLQNFECVVLAKKSDVAPPHKPRNHKKSRLDRMEEKLDLILERLDKHDELFRQHGWIK